MDNEAVRATLDVAASRLHHQRLMRTRLGDPAGVVRWLGAVQAQEYPSAKWGLGLRGAGFGDAEVEAAFNRGAILRTHLLRPTWHFVTPADIRWMLALTGPRVQAVCASYYRKREIDGPLFARSRKAIERALRDGRSLTRPELGAVLGRAGIEARTQRLAFLMLHAELEGVICSGPRRGKAFTYALLDERVPRATQLSADEALAELTRRYFTSHGPATVRDFSWWSGLTKGAIRRGIEMLGREISSAEVDGLTLWFTERSSPRQPARPSAHLLPIYDEFLIAYQDRMFLRRESATQGFYGRDGLNHYLIVDGRLAGSWKRSDRGDAVSVTIALAGRLSRPEMEAVRSAAKQFERFVGLPVPVSISTPR
jgi:hypothetical protein